MIDERQQEQLQGVVARVIFHRQANGFCVLQVIEAKTEKIVTVVGVMLAVAPGFLIMCDGQWENNPVYGLQFKSHTIQCTATSQRSAIHYLLHEQIKSGHCAYPYTDLTNQLSRLLPIDLTLIEQAIQQAIDEKQIVLDLIGKTPCLFPNSYYEAEAQAAAHLHRLLKMNQVPWDNIDLLAMIPWAEQRTGLILSTSQINALSTVLQHKIAIITGGPGVGKTTIISSFLAIMQKQALAVELCAPTGRSAKRLTEITGVNAKTIHRLLQYDPKTNRFRHHAHYPLPIDVLVVDETSMVDILIFQKLLSAVPDHAAVIFVGDIDQLPSVGPGAVFADLIRSQLIPMVKLTEIFRQAADSKIIINAHRINQGQEPLYEISKSSDFYTLIIDSPHSIIEKLIELIAERIPKWMACNPIADIQVLTPMNRGNFGSLVLNKLLQTTLNANAEPALLHQGITYAVGDKVIQIVNNYNKEIFNGDIGIVVQIDLENKSLRVSYDQKQVAYAYEDLNQINLAYAISIHKSQGSEFPIVIVVLAKQHRQLLLRNLLYTAVTRGKKLVVLVAERDAITMAIQNQKDAKRLTKLSEWLRS